MDFFITHISLSADKFVKEVLDKTFVSAGKTAKEFEKALNEKLGLSNPVALNSGTSALHLALAAADIGPGDEVIIPAQTFIATGMTVLMQDAKPVFADIQKETGNIDPQSFKSKITPKTKAVIPVHWGGYPCDMDEINAIAAEHGLMVIEDAAHALGAIYKGKPVGSISRFTAFSFQAIKHLTTGDGGALCCLYNEDFEKVSRRSWFGIDRRNVIKSEIGAREWDIAELGYKYHMNNFSAALGLANLEDIETIILRRRSIASVYRKEFENVGGLNLLDYKSDRDSAYWLFTILVENRNNFVKKLKSRSIPASVVDLRIDRNSVFGGMNEELKNQEEFEQKQISIPVHQRLTDDDVGLIIKTIREGW